MQYPLKRGCGHILEPFYAVNPRRFFGRLKYEMFYGRSWVDVPTGEFINEIDSYIKWYNIK